MDNLDVLLGENVKLKKFIRLKNNSFLVIFYINISICMRNCSISISESRLWPSFKVYFRKFFNSSWILFYKMFVFFSKANTKGAELLYQKIGDFCSIDKDTVVLDICCGTGTIGLTLANVKISFIFALIISDIEFNVWK